MILTDKAWVELKEVTVVAGPTGGLWTLAIDYVAGPQRLKVTADPSQRWTYSKAENLQCGPEGKPEANEVLTNCLYDKAPKGCLLAKIGGGNADYKGATGVTILPVGSMCVIDIDPTASTGTQLVRGPLFLTMNDDVTGFADHDKTITVKLWVPSRAVND